MSRPPLSGCTPCAEAYEGPATRPRIARASVHLSSLFFHNFEYLRATARAASDVFEDLLAIDVLVHQHAKKRRHHFLPGHISVVDRLIRIGIELVICRIVIV